MNSITDQYNGDPTYAELHVLTRSRPLVREMLKTAEFVKESAASLPSTAFAWEDERRFPVHTRIDTAASILYRSKLGSAVPAHVDAKLAKAAEIFELSDTLFAGTKTAAAPAVDHALKDRLPLEDEFQIKLAEDVLCRDFERLTLHERADAFSKLAQAAFSNKVALRPLTLKMAGLTTCNTDTLSRWLGARSMASTGIVREAFDKLATQIKYAGPELTDRDDLVKLASTIQQLDERAGLEKYYDRKLPDPMLTVFNTEKIAEDSCDVAGKKVACSKLMHLPSEIWDQVDVPELSKIAEEGNTVEFKHAFDTLPYDIKVVLRSYV